MRPVKITHTGVGQTAPVVVDYIGVPTEISWAVNTKGTAATYSVQYTLDDVFNTLPADILWRDAATAVTVTSDGVIDKPVRAIRLDVTSGAASGIDATIIQGVHR